MLVTEFGASVDLPVTEGEYAAFEPENYRKIYPWTPAYPYGFSDRYQLQPQESDMSGMRPLNMVTLNATTK
jgi:hypothetical protein